VYLDFYGLKRRPFDMTPDPSFFFPSQKHKEALASLTYTLTARRGFVVITGEIGCGKTTVCRTLLQNLDPAAKVAMLTNTILTPKQLLEAVCKSFGLASDKQNKVSLLTRLNRFFLEQNDAGNTAVLILDEAQNLSIKALEEVRLISNMETDTQKLVQIIFLGQPELRDKINRPELEQLRQRVSIRYHLRSLNKKEVSLYIEHRLRIAGDEGGGGRFTKGAVDALYAFSKGVPRLINVVCDQALLTGYLRETRRIDEGIVREIAAEFKSPETEGEEGSDADIKEERRFAFWRFFKKSRFRPPERFKPVETLSLGETSEEGTYQDDGTADYSDMEVLGKLSELELASIFPDNGAFVAKINGVRLRAADSLLGMKVDKIDKDRVIFRCGDKSYQLAIESPGQSEPNDSGSADLAEGKRQEDSPTEASRSCYYDG
jgi:general secretion pathway protein A